MPVECERSFGSGRGRLWNGVASCRGLGFDDHLGNDAKLGSVHGFHRDYDSCDERCHIFVRRGDERLDGDFRERQRWRRYHERWRFGRCEQRGSGRGLGRWGIDIT